MYMKVYYYQLLPILFKLLLSLQYCLHLKIQEYTDKPSNCYCPLLVHYYLITTIITHFLGNNGIIITPILYWSFYYYSLLLLLTLMLLPITTIITIMQGSLLPLLRTFRVIMEPLLHCYHFIMYY